MGHVFRFARLTAVPEHFSHGQKPPRVIVFIRNTRRDMILRGRMAHGPCACKHRLEPVG